MGAGDWFSWGAKDAQATPEGAPQNVASDSGPAVVEARMAATSELETSKRRRGRPRKDTTPSGGDSRTLSAELQGEIARQLEGLYDPKAWGALLAAPGDAALALTGNKERWNISADERATLGATGSAAARTMMITNPRTLALLMVGSALFSVYIPRVTKELAEIKLKREKEKHAPEKST